MKGRALFNFSSFAYISNNVNGNLSVNLKYYIKKPCFGPECNNNIFNIVILNQEYGGDSLMAERNNYKCFLFDVIMKKRVYFLKGNQKRFIAYLKKKSNLNWRNLSERLGRNENTLSKSYMFELCSLPYDLFKECLDIIDEDENKILKEYAGDVKEEAVIIGRKVLGEQNKYLGQINIIYSNTRLNLDISKVNYSKHDKEKGMILPNKITPKLAEEVGMQFGDGFLSAKKYDYRLKGNPYNEREYYIKYIKPLFKKLYNMEVNLRDFDRSFGFEIYSKALWEFKTKVLGIKTSPKYDIRFPEVLKVNDKNILAAFIRGLFDTDGCISFKTKYGYNKYYPSIELSLASKELIKDVVKLLDMLGFNPSVRFDKKYGRISVNGIGALKRYEKIIGWSSPKNLNKVNDWKKRYPQLNKDGECSTVASAFGCGPEDEGSIPSFRPNQRRLK